MRVVLDTNVIVSGLNFPGNERLGLEPRFLATALSFIWCATPRPLMAMVASPIRLSQLKNMVTMAKRGRGEKAGGLTISTRYGCDVRSTPKLVFRHIKANVRSLATGSTPLGIQV